MTPPRRRCCAGPAPRADVRRSNEARRATLPIGRGHFAASFTYARGVFERFPRLKVVLVESGLGWIPYFIERLDTMKRRHGWNHYDMLKELPSYYWHHNMAATFEEDTFDVEQRHRLGIDNLLRATDYPHPDCTWPESQQVLDTHFHDVPVEEARMIIGGNAARLYRL